MPVISIMVSASVRDGARSLELAMTAFAEERSPERAETVAMALAELGRFPEAVDWQRRIVEQVEAAGAAVSAPPGLRERLRSYERGSAVRAPWREQLKEAHR